MSSLNRLNKLKSEIYTYSTKQDREGGKLAITLSAAVLSLPSEFHIPAVYLSLIFVFLYLQSIHRQYGSRELAKLRAEAEESIEAKHLYNFSQKHINQISNYRMLALGMSSLLAAYLYIIIQLTVKLSHV